MALVITSQPANNSYQLAGNPIRFTVGTNALMNGPVVKPQFRIYALIDRLDEAGNPTVIGRVFGVPSATDTIVVSSVTYYRCRFEFSSYIYADVMQFAQTLPATGISNTHKHRYRISFFEYDLGAIIPPVLQSNTIFAVPGGFKIIRNYNFSFQGIFIAGTPKRFFLTHNQVFINPNTQLPVVFAPDGGTNVLQLNYQYKNGSVDGSIPVTTFSSVASPFFARCAVVDLTQINLEEAIGEPVNYNAFTSLSLVVVNQFSLVVVAALHLKVVEPTLFNRTFYYLNSYGVLTPFICTGKRFGKNKLTNQMAEVEVNNSTTQTTKLVKGSMVQYNNEYVTEYEQHTGHLTQTQFAQFEDFTRSPQRYEFVDGYYYPIILSDKEFAAPSDDQTIFTNKFKYTYAQNEQYI